MLSQNSVPFLCFIYPIWAITRLPALPPTIIVIILEGQFFSCFPQWLAQDLKCTRCYMKTNLNQIINIYWILLIPTYCHRNHNLLVLMKYWRKLPPHLKSRDSWPLSPTTAQKCIWEKAKPSEGSVLLTAVSPAPVAGARCTCVEQVRTERWKWRPSRYRTKRQRRVKEKEIRDSVKKSQHQIHGNFRKKTKKRE